MQATINQNEMTELLRKNSQKINLGDIYNDGRYLNESKFYIAYFNNIPNLILEININCVKANKWFFEKFKNEIKEYNYVRRYYNGSKQSELDDIYYFLFDDLLVNFDCNCSTVRFLFKTTPISKIENLISDLKKFRKRNSYNKPTIYLLVNSTKGMVLTELEVTKPKLSIQDNYNDDFLPIHETIKKRLSQKNNKGLVLLHGKPGTGKTSYIRYLLSSVKKNVIFLPPNMAKGISNPDLMSVLIENPNSIFVIEDAENVIMKRDNSGTSSVSALLNLSDGLLADCLNVQIICSFNTDISKVDDALMRKGRLIAKYEFTELQTDKAQKLSDKLGFKTTIHSPISLTEIYNQNEKDFKSKQSYKAVGFKASYA
jgi:hypothetical protein